MQVGMCLPHYGRTMEPEGMRTFAERVEELGFDSLWVTDHIVVPTDLDIVYKRNMLDPIATLNYLAGVTSRVRLGTSVIILPYRNPIVLAKELATADVLSGGRLIFGAASGWMEGEFRTLNADFERRGDVSDEALRVIRTLWSNPQPEYQGERFRIAGVTFSPETAQKPHPPIWIGGRSKRAIRRAVEYGDGWHPNRVSPEEVEEGAAYMKRLAERRGRRDLPVVSMRSAISFDTRDAATISGSPAEMADRLRRYEAAGVHHIALGLREVPFKEAMAQMERFAGEVLPGVQGKPAA